MTDSEMEPRIVVFLVSHTSREESCNGFIKKKAGPLSWAEQDRDRSVKDGNVSGSGVDEQEGSLSVYCSLFAE